MTLTSGQSIADLTTEIRPTSGNVPPALVGASMTVVDHCLYVFGGRKIETRLKSNELYMLNLSTFIWTRIDQINSPAPRYFHSCSAYKHYLVVYGGRGVEQYTTPEEELVAPDTILDDLVLFDTLSHTWRTIEPSPSNHQPCPRYAHLAVCIEDSLVIVGGQGNNEEYVCEVNVYDLQKKIWTHRHPLDSQHGAYSTVAFTPFEGNNIPRHIGKGSGYFTGSDGHISRNQSMSSMSSGSSHLPFWYPQDGLPVGLYANRNFHKVQRELMTFDPTADRLEVHDLSEDMSGAAQPPGLRFPSGDLLGQHLILTGIYRSEKQSQFHVWALNLANLVWTQIDSGTHLNKGSWSRGVLYARQQKYVVLGHRDRDLGEDYGNRQVNFNHVAVVDLEAFGIYTFPRATCAPVAQELGLSMLNEPRMADVEILTTDPDKSIPANSAILSKRWPTFAELVKNQTGTYKRLHFHENYTVTLAFVQFIYLDHLMTAQQHDPAILSRLLTLASMYSMDRLGDLATHALHQSLNVSTASMIYETAALNCRTALQIRALRVMIYAKKMLMRQIKEKTMSLALDSRPPFPLETTTVPTTDVSDDLIPNGMTSPHPLGVPKRLRQKDYQDSAEATPS